MPVKSQPTSSSASSNSQQQPSKPSWSVDVVPLVTLCMSQSSSFSKNPKVQEFIKVFDQPNIEKFLTFVAENHDLLTSNLNLTVFDLTLMYRRLMIWRLLKFEVYVSLDTLKDKLKCNNVDQVIEAMKDIHQYDHYLNKTLKVQINRFFKLSLTPKATMSDGVVDLMTECQAYPCITGCETAVNTAATTLAISLSGDSQHSVKALRLMLEIYRSNGCARSNILSMFKAVSAILGTGHPALIYVDIGICALSYRQECQEVIPYANRVIEYMTSFPCMKFSKAFFKIPSLLSNEPQQKLVEAITSGDLDKIKSSQLSLQKIEMLTRISRIYRLINLVEEKEIHNVIDLCRDLQFTSAEEILAFLVECREYISTESNEYGAYLVPNAIAEASTRRIPSSTK